LSLTKFATAVGYNKLPTGKFEEKVFVYRFWNFEVFQDKPIQLFAGINPDKSLTEVDKVLV
jgi:hypothetical protein